MNNNKSKFIIIGISLAVILSALAFVIFNNKDNKKNNDNVTIAVIGNEDHGKTTLTSAITKMYGDYVSTNEIDSSVISTEADGVVYNYFKTEYVTKSKKYIHFDMPSNEDYIKGIISGDIKLDGAILVVSAIEGLMTETYEQVKLISQIGVPKIVVYINKCDLVKDDKVLDQIEYDIRDLLNEYGFDGSNTPIVRGSALKAIEGDKEAEQSIEQLMKETDEWLEPLSQNEEKVPTKKFKAHIYALTADEGGRHTPFFNNYQPTIKIGKDSVQGKVELIDNIELVAPGNDVDINIHLDSSVEVNKGMKVQLCEGERIVAVGFVDEILD